MKLRYRIDVSGYYIPQWYDQKAYEWKDFKVKNLTTRLTNLAHSVGFKCKWENKFHYTPKKGEKTEEMSLIFPNEMNVMAFLGAAKSVFTEKVKEFEI